MYNDLNTTGMLKAAAAQPRESMLDNMNMQLQSCLKELHGSGTRLHQLADRIIGTRPEAAGSATANAPAGSSMQSLERSLGDLQNLVRAVSDATERLERL